MNNINTLLESYINKLKKIEAQLTIINEEGDRLMEVLDHKNEIIYGEIGSSPVGIDEPIINESNIIKVEDRLVDVTKAALKLADMKDQIISEVRRFQEEIINQRSLTLSNTRRSNRRRSARGLQKSRKHNQKLRKSKK
jgi:hypothetical protein